MEKNKYKIDYKILEKELKNKGYKVTIINSYLLKINKRFLINDNWVFYADLFVWINCNNKFDKLDNIINFIPVNSENFRIGKNIKLKNKNQHIWANKGSLFKKGFSKKELIKVNKKEISNHSLCLMQQNYQPMLKNFNDNLKLKNGKSEKALIILLENYINGFLQWKYTGIWPKEQKHSGHLKNEKYFSEIQKYLFA